MSNSSSSYKLDETSSFYEHSNAENNLRTFGATEFNNGAAIHDTSNRHKPLMRSQTKVTHERGHFWSLFLANKRPTVTYCLVFWSFGMCLSFLGPTLWDLGCQTGTVMSTMMWVFFSQSLFIMVGSVAAAFLVERFTANPVLFGGVCGIFVTLASIPFCHGMVSLGTILAIMGFNMGLIDTTANVSMIRLYGIDVSPFLQAMHFFYGFGAFLSPIIVDPFVANYDCSRLVSNSSKKTWIEEAWLDSEDPSVVEEKKPSSLEEAQSKIQVHFAFWIMAALQIPVAALVWSLFSKKPEKCDYADPAAADNSMASANGIYKHTAVPNSKWTSVVESMKGCCTHRPFSYVLVIFLTGLLLFLADGLQASYSGFIFSFARVSVRGLKAKQAAVINACFWGMFAVGRFLAVFAAVQYTPFTLLVFDTVGAFASMLFMSAFSHTSAAIYIGTSLFGLFLSSVYPSAISLAEQFVDITPSATSCIVVAAAAGEVLYPLIVGHLFNTMGPVGFLVTGNITICLVIFVFFFQWMTGNYIRKHPATLEFLAKHFPRIFAKGEESESLVVHDYLTENYDTASLSTTESGQRRT